MSNNKLGSLVFFTLLACITSVYAQKVDLEIFARETAAAAA